MRQALLLAASIVIFASNAHAERQNFAANALEAALFKGTAHWVCRCTCDQGPGLEGFTLDAPGKCDGSEDGTHCENADGSEFGVLDDCRNVLVGDE